MFADGATLIQSVNPKDELSNKDIENVYRSFSEKTSLLK